MGALLGPDFPSAIALAVSGGGDSMAMLTLAHNWAHVWGVRLWVVTVDHGLRPEAAGEVALVAETCAELGHPHALLRWRWDGQGNLMDAARRGRLEMIGRWRGGLAHVLLAHTRDDVAETFLMRLARGSGVDGLSAMAPMREIRQPWPRAPLSEAECAGACPSATPVVDLATQHPDRFHILRPCLDMGREELRHYLRVLKGRWADDPSNQDDRYERARIRKLLAELRSHGLGAETLAATAGRMSRARDVLRQRAVEVWALCGRAGEVRGAATGEMIFDRAVFETVERDTQLRLLAAALQFIASAEYRPRAAPLEALLDRLLAGGAGTLHGCEARTTRDEIRLFREYAAVADLRGSLSETALWDGKWRVFHKDLTGLEIRALGDEGWLQAGAAREGGPSHPVARGLPAVWEGGRLVACDALGIGPGETTQLWPMGTRHIGFPSFLLSH
ncbi:tRNA lysidine(34) synthetase TilS [Salipiger sp. P9]|uniref:tRNA lysidine(34) synthetase TilS n=1 Tax=Salipiger pentaromativorans TaxID=2943193 RepID=UPI0021573F4C|nr:tRNA lysidine(34) synthetase TilS [Salipiger pentaromativorans]MCR8549335.1 tRNA lysidine(34) synthetase TilS [Salipiger pentaromativorans]